MSKKKLAREDVIRALKELEAEGKQPGRKALERKGINGYWVAKLIPEGLTQLKLEHGIRLSPQEQSHSGDELLEKIDEIVSQLRRVPSWSELRRETKITDKVFLKRFGNKGKRELFNHYRTWLEEYHPESENIRLVDAYLEGQDKTESLAGSEVQDEMDGQQTPHDRFKSHCEHCGNVTFKSRIGSHKIPESSQELVEYKLYRCEICEHVILRKESVQFAVAISSGSSRTPKQQSITSQDTEQLWPPSLEFPPEVPERIRKIYEEARYVKSKSPSSFVVQIRRALEAVTKERNAVGKVLIARIDWLIQNGHLPSVFGQMSHISRMIANLGAHDAEIEVKKSDANIVDEFFRAIIEYIYVAPAKVIRIRAMMEKK